MTSPPAVRAGIVKTGHRYGRVPVPAELSFDTGGLRQPVFHSRWRPGTFVHPLPKPVGVTIKNHISLRPKAVPGAPTRFALEMLAGIHRHGPRTGVGRLSVWILQDPRNKTQDQGSDTRQGDIDSETPLSQCVRLPRRTQLKASLADAHWQRKTDHASNRSLGYAALGLQVLQKLKPRKDPMAGTRLLAPKLRGQQIACGNSPLGNNASFPFPRNQGEIGPNSHPAQGNIDGRPRKNCPFLNLSAFKTRLMGIVASSSAPTPGAEFVGVSVCIGSPPASVDDR